MWQLWHLILSSHLASEGRFHDPYFIGEDTQAQSGGDTFPQGHTVSDKAGRAESESKSSVLGAPNTSSLDSSQRPGGPLISPVRQRANGSSALRSPPRLWRPSVGLHPVFSSTMPLPSLAEASMRVRACVCTPVCGVIVNWSQTDLDSDYNFALLLCDLE